MQARGWDDIQLYAGRFEMIVQFRSRELEIDDACQARAKAQGCDPIEQRLWEAGFTRKAAIEAANQIRGIPQNGV